MKRRKFVKLLVFGATLAATAASRLVHAVELFPKIDLRKLDTDLGVHLDQLKDTGLIVDDAGPHPIIQNYHAPDPEKLYAMVVDLRRCIGCHSCESACRDENNVPQGAYRTKVHSFLNRGGELYFFPRLCMHCDNAPCVKVCPTTASYRREDGVILIDYKRCIGCKYCMVACPYDARYINFSRKTADKCTFCSHRIDKGLDPACVDICPVKARVFGDLNDPNSKVSQILAKNNVSVLKQDLRTFPKVYYLGLDKALDNRKFELIELENEIEHKYNMPPHEHRKGEATRVGNYRFSNNYKHE
ncbi:MAG: 4Fe-4S dicluster domain-containing protein [Candidatus Hydrothermarchaeales archaeon]